MYMYIEVQLYMYMYMYKVYVQALFIYMHIHCRMYCTVMITKLFPFWFQSSSPIPITPFQVPPLLCTNESADTLYLRQVHQPFPRNKTSDPASPIFWQSIS